MRQTEIYFQIIDKIIIASRIKSSVLDQNIVDQMLLFLGEQFLNLYEPNIEQTEFDWNSIGDQFDQEVLSVFSDDEIGDELKGETLNKILDEILIKEYPVELLSQRIDKISDDLSSQQTFAILRNFDNILEVIPRLEIPLSLKYRIEYEFKQAKKLVQIKNIRKDTNVYIMCSDYDLYNFIFRGMSSYGINPIQIKSFDMVKNFLQVADGTKEKFHLIIVDLLKISEFKLIIDLYKQILQNPPNIMFIPTIDVDSETKSFLQHYKSIISYTEEYCSFTNDCPSIYEIIIQSLI